MITSRIGRMPVTILDGVEVVLKEEHLLMIKGPKGLLTVNIHPFLRLTIAEKRISLSFNLLKNQVKKKLIRLYQSISGTIRSEIYNGIYGVSHGFESKLSLVGVGYRAQLQGQKLYLNLGYSHPIIFSIPEGISIEVPAQNEVIVRGIIKHLVGKVSATIRQMRLPEPYKGKGIRYANEVIEIKETKKK